MKMQTITKIRRIHKVEKPRISICLSAPILVRVDAARIEGSDKIASRSAAIEKLIRVGLSVLEEEHD